MRHRWRLIVAGIVTLVIGLLVTFPARVAYRWFAPPQLKLAGISGSIWHGTASQGSAGGIYLTDVAWHFKPLALLTGQLAFSTRSNPVSGFLDADIAVGIGGRVTMSDVAGAVSLASLAAAFPLNGVEGDVTLRFEELVIDGGFPVEATGTVGIANLISRYLSATTLGDYRAKLRTGDDGISGTLEAVSGVLELDGTVRLMPDRNYQLLGEVAARPEAPAAIARQLEYLGSPNSRGRHEFRIEGQL
ncbi:MAG: type II secretion system protein N [Woeseia sp.]